MATIEVRELINLIEDATRSKRILVPSEDYYARPGDSTTETLRYISPDLLIDGLKDLID